jgi:hypothetical protein
MQGREEIMRGDRRRRREDSLRAAYEAIGSEREETDVERFRAAQLEAMSNEVKEQRVADGRRQAPAQR